MVATAQIKETTAKANEVKMYDSIHILPLPVFIDCMVDENDIMDLPETENMRLEDFDGDTRTFTKLKGLIISGEPTDEELASTWNDILQQYGDAIGSIGNDRKKSLIKLIAKDQIRIEQIHQCISILSSYYVPYFARRLNELLHVKFSFDVTRPAEYDKELQRCINRSKGLSLDIQLNQMTLEGLIQAAPKEPDVKITRQYFDNILLSLSDHAGYEISEEKMTVYKFCERIRRFNKYWEAKKNKPKP